MEETRDSNIIFDEQTHRYTIRTDPDHEYISVTSWVTTLFPKFDQDAALARSRSSPHWDKGPYVGMTNDEIKESWFKKREESASDGKELHKLIEEFLLGKEVEIPDGNAESFKLFKEFINGRPDWKIFRTEWMIYDEEFHICGTLDALFRDADGNYILVDWKRSKKLTYNPPSRDFGLHWSICDMKNISINHYKLQLNTYKYILEKNYGIKISKMLIVGLHPQPCPEEKRIIEIEDLQFKISMLLQNRNG